MAKVTGVEKNDPVEPTLFVIFGGGGDLSWRKLVPALFNLCQHESMPVHFALIAVDRSPMELNKLLAQFYTGVQASSRNTPFDSTVWEAFSKHIQYIQGDFNDLHTYQQIKEKCAEQEKDWNLEPCIIFYMATPPSLFADIAKNLKKSGLTSNKDKSRFVVEKPLGYDLESSQALNKSLRDHLDESQIFRIDHYLGKETVQNILAFRFANPLFEPIWNRRYIDYVTITVAETVGVELRGGYYDQAGALRDMVQNHLLQLLCLVAMEPMLSFQAQEIHNKKIDVIHAIRPIHADKVHECVIRGQYREGWIQGEKVVGYREEPGVSPDSTTETFVAIKLYIDNWRWQEVPFYLRTGKRMPNQTSNIMIQFRSVPHQAFPPEATLDWQPSHLILSIQPEEGIVLHFQAKQPGTMLHLRPVDMKFNYEETFHIPSRDAYETLLYEVMRNDATLFMRGDQVEAAWKLLMPLLNMWAISPPSDFPNYDAGTWGPEAANWLLSQQKHNWPAPGNRTKLRKKS